MIQIYNCGIRLQRVLHSIFFPSLFPSIPANFRQPLFILRSGSGCVTALEDSHRDVRLHCLDPLPDTTAKQKKKRFLGVGAVPDLILAAKNVIFKRR